MSAVLPIPTTSAPTSDFSRGKADQLFSRLEQAPVVVYRHAKPISVIVGYGQYIRACEEVEDLEDSLMACERISHADAYLTEDEMMAALGTDEADIANAPEVTID